MARNRTIRFVPRRLAAPGRLPLLPLIELEM